MQTRIGKAWKTLFPPRIKRKRFWFCFTANYVLFNRSISMPVHVHEILQKFYDRNTRRPARIFTFRTRSEVTVSINFADDVDAISSREFTVNICRTFLIRGLPSSIRSTINTPIAFYMFYNFYQTPCFINLGLYETRRFDNLKVYLSRPKIRIYKSLGCMPAKEIKVSKCWWTNKF